MKVSASAASGQHVVVRAADELVDAGATVDHVVAVIALEPVLAAIASDRVDAVQAQEVVVRVVADEDVVLVAAAELLDADERVDAGRMERLAERKVDGDRRIVSRR